MLLTSNKRRQQRRRRWQRREISSHCCWSGGIFSEMSTKGLSPLCLKHETLKKQHILHDMNAWKEHIYAISRQYDIMKAFNSDLRLQSKVKVQSIFVFVLIYMIIKKFFYQTQNKKNVLLEYNSIYLLYKIKQ